MGISLCFKEAEPIRTPAGDPALERASSKKKIEMELRKMPCSKRISSTAVTAFDQGATSPRSAGAALANPVQEGVELLVYNLAVPG
jgi:hypothetical protein